MKACKTFIRQNAQYFLVSIFLFQLIIGMFFRHVEFQVKILSTIQSKYYIEEQYFLFLSSFT